MIQLDLKSRMPIYEQLVQKLKQLIISDTLKPNEKLPSVRALSSSITINPNTIQKAYRELEREGYIYSIPGKGSFVSDKNDINLEKLKELKEELKKLLFEAMYIGMKKTEIHDLIDEIEFILKGGN